MPIPPLTELETLLSDRSLQESLLAIFPKVEDDVVRRGEVAISYEETDEAKQRVGIKSLSVEPEPL